MALVLADRVLETTSVAGTGDASLSGAIVGYQPFSVIGGGNTTYYTIVAIDDNGAPTGDWEVGIGTYVTSGNKISRDTVLSSSNGGALVYFASGTKQIFLDLPSEELPVASGDVTGPASAVANNFAAFNLTTGKLIKDSGYNASSFATAAQGAKADTAVQPSSLGSAAYLTAGAALGVATLDAGGKVPTSQIPQMGDLNYQGTWNASTNTPTLTSSAGTKGFYYVVSVAGSTNLNGITDWKVGDWAVFNGSVWEKIDNTDAVTSVNGFTGTVVLTASDVGATPATSGTSILYGNGTGGTSNVTIGSGVAFVGGTLSATGSGGDVVGPASATDNAIARFDTTTGKLIQNSVVTVSDTGVIAGAPSITNINFVDFDTTYATALTEGQLGWDGNNTLALGMAGGNVVQHIGEDSFFYIKASSTITKGQVIMFTGAVGASGVLTGAPSTGVTSPQYIMGVAAEDIATNAFGLVQWFGEITNVNTNGFNEGDILYYDSAVTGGLTNVFPTSGPIVTVAAVAKKSPSGGVLVIRVSATQRMTASTGISVSQSNAGATITNTAPDQTVAITGAGGAVVTGTYPNFTITTPSGTVTSVTGTAPIASTGGATPAISISQATTSTDGYLSSTDWNTFNGKGSGTVTSVGGTGTVNGITLTGTVTSTGNLTLGGTLGGIGNSQLTNSAVTIGSTSVSLGATATTLAGLTSVTSTTVVASGVVGSSATGALTMPSGTTAERPGSPVAGMIRYNSTLNVTEYYNGTAWYSITATTPVAPSTVEYLVVAGGGGGSSGGGGAGGFRTATGLAVTAGTPITVTVGTGGAAGSVSATNGTPGGDSVFGSITSAGGGYGNRIGNLAPPGGGPGGSGGGGGAWSGGTTAGGAASPAGQGNAGGSNGGRTSPPYPAGGGGGASAAGQNAPSASVSGNGGAGTASSISGSSVTYAGGGGGGSYGGGTAGTGGAGGGGNGSGTTSGAAGTANTGGGGGGGESVANGGAGGSGIVIIRYPDTNLAAASTTGSPTITVAGGYRVYAWTGSGSITF